MPTLNIKNERVYELARELSRATGESMTGAALDLARSVVRRAERRTVALSEAGELPDSHALAYLNRLADLLFVMARAADGGFLPLRTHE